MRRFEVAGSRESKEEIYGRREEKKTVEEDGLDGGRRLAEPSRPRFLEREQLKGREKPP